MDSWSRTVSFALLIFFCPHLLAGFCNDRHITDRHRDEAAIVSNPTTMTRPQPGVFEDYIGDEDYNAHVIACNRRRDWRGDDVEDEIDADFQFGNNLPPNSVRGMYNYFGNAITSKGYGYQIERAGSRWLVTVPVYFRFPKLKLTKYIDISLQLADDLGIRNTVCAVGATERSGGKIVRGFVDTSGPVEACRLDRGEVFQNRPIEVHIMEFWREAIEQYWSRPPLFNARVLIRNMTGEIDDDIWRTYKRHKIDWQVRFNMNPNVTPRYKGSVLFPHPMYVGVDRRTIVHEFGHQLGLDDEYAKSAGSDCDQLYDNAVADSYIMCDGFGTLIREHEQKEVYRWIVTRRYSVGDDLDIDAVVPGR